MTTRYDTDRTGMARDEIKPDSLPSGQAKPIALTFPYNVSGAQSFGDLKVMTQANLDALREQMEAQLNRVGRFMGEEGLPTINKDQFFSKAKTGTDT